MCYALIQRVKADLIEQSFYMNDSWLRECIEYYITENSDQNQSAVSAFVKSQWLLSDLREISNEKGSMPRELSQHDKISLPGKYIVQVEKIYDISQPKYSQLQKIRNVSDINVQETAIAAPAWKPKGKRMIQMFLTDGVQDFSAIEYQPIETLKDTLLPGFKVIIIGPVICRKGVILLKEKNYRGIGGEVESLLKLNALENVLARAINVEQNENPYGDDILENDAANPPNDFPTDDFEIDLEHISQIEQLNMESRDSPVDLNIENPRSLSEIPKEPNTSSRMTAPNTWRPQNAGFSNIQAESVQVIMVDNFDEYSDMFHGINDEELSPLPPVCSKDSKDFKILSRAELKPLITKPSSFEYASDKSHSNSKNNANAMPPLKHSPATFTPDDYFDDIDFEDDLVEDMLRENSLDHSEVKQNSLPKGEVKTADCPSLSIFTKGNNSTEHRRPTPSSGKRSAEVLSPIRSTSKVMCFQTTPQLKNKNRKITEFTKKVVAQEVVPPKICDFICDIIREPIQGVGIFKTVRGKVTQLGNLTKNHTDWDLTASIADGTASLEINFASQVLEELIGFSVTEFVEKRKLRKGNPAIEEYLRKGFRQAEAAVRRMDALMDLELSEGSIPKVVNVRELTGEQKELIEKRIKLTTI